MDKVRVALCALIAVAIVAVAGAPARAEEPMGSVKIETMTVAAGLGYAWGNGVLEYRGKQYPFTVKAFSIADVGVLKRSMRGEVYNLRSPEQFEGTFMGAQAGATVGMGAGAAAMRNQHDVNMVWTTTNQGLGVTLAHSGIHVKFTDEARALAAHNRVPSADETPAAAPRSPR